MRPSEASFYFDANGRRLYALTIAPAAPQTGIVLCNGFGKEFEISRTILASAARELAGRGHACLELHYGGYGDSSGEFEDASVTSMCADIEAAIDELRRRSGVERVVLLGLRFGATLAELVADRRTDLAGVVLWEPLVRPWQTLFGALRHTVAMQLLVLGRVAFTREQIVANVRHGKPSSAGGYDFNIIDEGFRLSAQLVGELEGIDLAARPRASNARTLIVRIAKAEAPVAKDLANLVEAITRQGASCSTTSAVVPCLPWAHELVFAQRFPSVVDPTITWLEEGA